MPFACSLTCCWSDGDDGRAVGNHRRRVAGYSRRRRRLQRERVLGGPREVLAPPALYRQVTRPSTRRPTPVSAQRGQYQVCFRKPSPVFEMQPQGHPDPTTLSPRPRRGGGRARSRSAATCGAGPLGLLFYCGTRPVPMRLGIKGRACLLRSLYQQRRRQL